MHWNNNCFHILHTGWYLWQRRQSVFLNVNSQPHVILHTPFVIETALRKSPPFIVHVWLSSKNWQGNFRIKVILSHRIKRVIIWKFGEVWSSISKVINVMHWNNTVSTSPERWKCGPSLKQHWGSALPSSYMCDWAVRTDKAGRQDWKSNYQHYIDIGPICFFFFFFFFKIWYLAENKREKIVFPKYPLLREM